MGKRDKLLGRITAAAAINREQGHNATAEVLIDARRTIDHPDEWAEGESNERLKRVREAYRDLFVFGPHGGGGWYGDPKPKPEETIKKQEDEIKKLWEVLSAVRKAAEGYS